MGALIAEISAEALTGDIQAQTSELRAQGLSDHQIKMVLLSRANFNADIARLATGSLAFIAQQDINAALSAAGNALENNYFQTAIPALIRAAAAVPRLYSALKATLFATTAIVAAVLTNEAINNVNDSSAETERRNSPSSSNATSAGNPPADWMIPYLPDSSTFSTPIQESKPSIFSTPIYPEQRPSIFITPTYDGPTWQEGFTPWTGPLPQNITVPVDLPDMTVLESSRDKAKLSSNGVKLRYWLASRQQIGEPGSIIAGPGSKREFEDAPRIVAQYGGKVEDWVKKSGSKYGRNDEKIIETHWVENIKTGERVEFKTKIEKENKKKG